MRLGVIALLVAVGCGPIEYVNQVTRKAATAVESAKTAEADRYSPYHYTLAVEYLHRAREEAAAADFQAANRFGRRAQDAANTAKAEAVANKGKPIEDFYPGFTPPGETAKKPPVAPLSDDDDDGENPL